MENKNYVNLNEQALKSLKYYMPENDFLRQMADLFSLYSDVTRLKILSALALNDMCVNDLSSCLELNQTTVSHQLKLLKNMKLVEDFRNGKVITYKISNEITNEIMLRGVEYFYGKEKK